MKYLWVDIELFSIGRHAPWPVRASRKSKRMSLRASRTMRGRFQESFDIGLSVEMTMRAFVSFRRWPRTLGNILPRGVISLVISALPKLGIGAQHVSWSYKHTTCKDLCPGHTVIVFSGITEGHPKAWRFASAVERLSKCWQGGECAAYTITIICVQSAIRHVLS